MLTSAAMSVTEMSVEALVLELSRGRRDDQLPAIARATLRSAFGHCWPSPDGTPVGEATLLPVVRMR
ncbi:hypothetical protein [Rhodococcus sp. DMU1]|uniref:hypothetical protein n=1 Tax=Rhodococcus sp. DMU1 TaxID=2722825 RepID=UPI00143E26DE|nr:hypothetical protein [Rhodococcus sp. DMU1]QIX48476.1 hypothetical protein HFP48_02150 [Rhodococcus sp. DMU1]